MTAELDLRGEEPRALLAAADFADARVLEIGSGDGRLTARYAGTPRYSVGLDSCLHAIVRARRGLSRDLDGRVGFLSAGAVALPFRDEAFDIALLAWSL